MVRSFRELIENEEIWTKQDLIDLIKEEDLSEDDISEITELIYDIAEYNYYEFDNDLAEKMSNSDLQKSARRRKTSSFKKIQLLKSKCLKKHKKQIDNSRNSQNRYICNSLGKLVKSKMSKEKRRQMRLTRKKNKNKII